MSPEGEAKGARPRLWLLLALLLLFVPGQRHDLWGNDEPREAEIAREMYSSGEWVVPRLNGIPFLEKPPLTYWGTALVFHALAGPSEEWCRLPSALWGFAGALATVWLGTMLADRRTGLLAGFILATTGEWLYISRILLVDVPLASCVALSLAFFWYGYRSTGVGKRLGYLGFAAAAGGAFMAKGAVGIMLPAAAVISFLVWRRERAELARLFTPWNIAALAALTLPWFLMLAARGGGNALTVFLWDNQVRRFFSSSADHAHAPWFYLPVLFEVLLPWAIFVVPAAVRMARPGGPNTGVDYRRQYLIAVTIAPLILLSAASGKRHLYLLPLLPGFSVMLAVWLAEAWSTADMRWEEMWRRWGSVLFALLPCAAWGSAFYLAAARGHVMAVTAAGVVGSVSAGGVALVYIFRRGRAASPWLMVGLLAAAYAAALSPSPWKMIEQEKGAASLREMLTAHVGRNDTLSGYTPSERVQGIVAFSRRATFPMLWTPVELDAVLGASRSNVVLIPERDYRELREHGLTRAPAKVIASCALGRRRQALLRGRGPG